MNTFGAHEVLELHEIMSDAIHGLNTLKLYRPYAQDHQLQSMMDRHMHMLTVEYNNLVQMAHNQGAGQAVPNRRAKLAGMTNINQGYSPTYGLRNPQTQTPASTNEEIDDADVAVCIINCHKQTAALKMKAALEMAHPALRQMIQTAANNSADMAYEGFQYANQRGYYQIPTLKDTTADTFLHSYGSAPSPVHHTGGQPVHHTGGHLM